jgi:bifunctional NMN adenylyltransferase/nudix hydrolase
MIGEVPVIIPGEVPVSKPFGTLVFIGRFQPFHNGHLHVLTEALREAERVLIVVGSSYSARNPRNPWTEDEREDMIRASVREANIDPARVVFGYVSDHPYNDDAWIANVQAEIYEKQLGMGVTGLVGYAKDRSSYYLKMFPGMPSLPINSQWGTLSSTDIRKMYFEGPVIPDPAFVPGAVANFLRDFYLKPEYKWLMEEHFFYKDYDPKKYPVQILCADAVVVQSGHVLLVERGAAPGRGLLALPGGHVNPDETIRAAAIRELLEETGISDQQPKTVRAVGTELGIAYKQPKAMPKGVLGSYIRAEKIFDNPTRSLRGRVVTQAVLFQLPRKEQLYWVKGNDDASSATWHELGTLDPSRMFEDHAAIIETMTTGAL